MISTRNCCGSTMDDSNGRERINAMRSMPGVARSNEIGLPAVRQYRLNELANEEKAWNLESESRPHAHPELVPRLILRVEGLGNA